MASNSSCLHSTNLCSQKDNSTLLLQCELKAISWQSSESPDFGDGGTSLMLMKHCSDGEEILTDISCFCRGHWDRTSYKMHGIYESWSWFYAVCSLNSFFPLPNGDGALRQRALNSLLDSSALRFLKASDWRRVNQLSCWEVNVNELSLNSYKKLISSESDSIKHLCNPAEGMARQIGS